MIYGFYFRILKITNSEKVSLVISRLIDMLYTIRFFLLKLKIRKRKLSICKEEALKMITDIYPNPALEIEYYNKKINNELDLSIVIPVYNYVKIIRDNIESVLRQKTKYTYEIILVDDGSTDGARDIVLEYQNHPKIKVILQENQGIAGARNNGINHATGRYLMFVDCDDTVHEDMVEVLLDRAYSEDCDIVMCAHNLSKEKDGRVYQVIPNIYPSKNLLGYKNGDEIMNYAGLPWGKVYKRQMWNHVRFLPGYWYEDTIIQMLLFTQCKKFSYVSKVCYEYRWYENNFSHIQEKTSSVKCIDRYWMLVEIIQIYKNLNLPLDAEFYTLLLKHLSAYYYPTIKELEPDVVEALFILGCELLEEYRPKEKVKLPYMLKITEKAMIDRDIELWKLASVNQ